MYNLYENTNFVFYYIGTMGKKNLVAFAKKIHFLKLNFFSV